MLLLAEAARACDLVTLLMEDGVSILANSKRVKIKRTNNYFCLGDENGERLKKVYCLEMETGEGFI